MRATAIGAFGAILCALTLSAPVFAQISPSDNPYTDCSFYPQAPSCAAVLKQAMSDNSVAALGLRQAYQGYARYLEKASTPLDDADKRYLQQVQITLPSLTSQNEAGLHNVINDPALADNAAARRAAVNDFISRALQAQVYCIMESCPAPASTVPSS